MMDFLESAKGELALLSRIYRLDDIIARDVGTVFSWMWVLSGPKSQQQS